MSNKRWRKPLFAIINCFLRVIKVVAIMKPKIILCLTLIFGAGEIWISTPTSGATVPAQTSDALAWYDTLGFPDAKNLPYVRVSTGRWTQSGNQARENRFVEGFLVGEESNIFSVFICYVPDFRTLWYMGDAATPLTTVRFVRKPDGPAYSRVEYQVLDLEKAASETLQRGRDQVSQPDTFFNLDWSNQALGYQARVFALGRACLQNGLSDTGLALMNFAGNGVDVNDEALKSKPLRDVLQQQIGDAVLGKAESDCADPSISWAELLKEYENFGQRFPANHRIAYAKEAADVLRKMIAEEAAHHPKPLEQMSPAEQVAENIYQLRNFHHAVWIMYGHYPDDARTSTGEQVLTPVDRLVDLGPEAVPQLIATLNDRRFTRSLDSRSMQGPGPDLRVGDIAQIILEHMSGRSFYAKKTGTTRQQAEAWWAEVQNKGEKQVLTDAAALGGEPGCTAARKLVEKYPDAAMPAIEAGFRATPIDGVRCDYVKAAARLPGDVPMPFLKSSLTPDNGPFTRMYAADALNARGDPEAVTAMIEAWQKYQPTLASYKPDAARQDLTGTFYNQAGTLIAFLANSGNAAAIDALGHDLQKTPVEVRLAAVQVFLPFGSMGLSATGPSVTTDFGDGITKLPTGPVGAAVERLLVSELDDSGRRVGMQGDIGDASFKDPRVCDMAALVLSKRWPDNYHFHWTANAAECDAQIAKLRDRWRSENGPTAQPH
jgi:hypothetical protein